MSREEKVESGHQIWVNAPIGSKAKKREVEGDLFISALERDIAIECRLVSWQLQLSLRACLENKQRRVGNR